MVVRALMALKFLFISFFFFDFYLVFDIRNCFFFPAKVRLCRELEGGGIRVLDSFSFSRFLGAKGRRSLTSSGRSSRWGGLSRSFRLSF